MNAAVDKQLAALTIMRKTELQIEWQRHYKSDPPDIAPGLLRFGIAYRIQEKSFGGLSRSAQAKLRRIAKGEPVGTKPIGKLKPGTRLVRRWNDQTIVVLVTDDGFLFDDQKYGSLSEIARQVTEAHWSGPRFFGLTKAKVSADAA